MKYCHYRPIDAAPLLFITFTGSTAGFGAKARILVAK